MDSIDHLAAQALGRTSSRYELSVHRTEGKRRPRVFGRAAWDHEIEYQRRYLEMMRDCVTMLTDNEDRSSSGE